MGRWTLTALVVNSIVGSGIFGLPSLVAGYVGRWSPLAYLIAAAIIAVIMGCFAEVASRFGESGGPYLYARVAFGRFVGIEMGWLVWLVRLTAAAAGADLFTNYLAEFWPDVTKPLIRLAVLTILIGFLAFVNYRGVKSGAVVSNVFTVAKLLPLFSFAIAGGIFLLHTHPVIRSVTPSGTPVPMRNWLEVVLVLMFAYGGFEGAVVPMAEAKNPQRDAPFALGAALVTVAILFCAIQYVVVAVLPAAAATDRPLAVAARQMWGPPGAMLIAVGALISVYGYLSAQMLNTPRLTFALGERGDVPSIFSRIHPRFRTPHVSILVFAASVWCLAVLGNFKWNVLISSAGRLFAYGFVCAALPVLRRKYPDAAAYRLPAGNFFAALGIIFMLVLVSRMRLGGWIVILVTMAIAFVNWLWARNRQEIPENH
jgi:basic amino acid/polyamine antiporter, APA family